MLAERHATGQKRLIWPPSPGFFKMTMVRKGWQVPCRIVHGDGRWHAVIDGRTYDSHPDPSHAPRLADVWHNGTIIDESEYDYLAAVREHARATGDEHHPSLNPTTSIHPNRLRPIIPRTPTWNR